MNRNSRSKPLLFSILLLLLVISAGCSPLRSNAETTIINYGHGFMPESPQDLSAIEFKKEVEEKSNGALEVNIFPSSQLGTAREMFEGLQLGTQEVALVPTARISGFAPELQLFDLPYLFPTREIAYEIMDGEVGSQLLKDLEEQFVVGVAFYEDGFKQFTSNQDISNADAFRGQSFRTMESPIVMEQFRALEANPTPIDFAELYNSLQLGVIDGQENPLVTIHNMKYFEVQDYLAMTDHAYLAHVLLFNQVWFNDLPAEHQEILMTAGKNAAVWERAKVAEVEEENLQTIRDFGTQILEYDEESTQEMIEKTKPVYDEYRRLFGDDVLDKALEFIENYNEL